MYIYIYVITNAFDQSDKFLIYSVNDNMLYTCLSLSLSFYRCAKVESAKAPFRPAKSFQISDDALNPEALSFKLSSS